MKGKHNRKSTVIDRRSFVSHSFKLAALGTLLLPVIEACNNNNKNSTPAVKPPPGKDKKTVTQKHKKPRTTWSHEGLVMNTKTGMLHLPSSKIYHYYDEIKPVHLKDISLAAWVSQAGEPMKIHKQQSGNILEVLALQDLSNGINDQSLATAATTLAKAFSASCENAAGQNLNVTNFRLHELLLQFISLNNNILANEKWDRFSNSIKRPVSLRKRQKWMETATAFNERVNYILTNKNDYIARLNQRAKRYSFT